jgi:hypothetical protein
MDDSLSSDDLPDILLLHHVSAITDRLFWDIALPWPLNSISGRGTTANANGRRNINKESSEPDGADGRPRPATNV